MELVLVVVLVVAALLTQDQTQGHVNIQEYKEMTLVVQVEQEQDILDQLVAMVTPQVVEQEIQVVLRVVRMVHLV